MGVRPPLKRRLLTATLKPFIFASHSFWKVSPLHAHTGSIMEAHISGMALHTPVWSPAPHSAVME